MPQMFAPINPRPADLANDVIALVQKWLDAPVSSSAKKASSSAALLAEVLKDQNGLDFTIGFVDRVVRPEDLGVAARNLTLLAKNTPTFLPWFMKAGVRLGGLAAPILPWAVVPVARTILRQMVAHLIVDARPRQLGTSIAKLKKDHTRLNINLLGEAVLGDKEADARLAGTKELLARPDVDYVSIKVSSVVSQLNMWAFEESVQKITDRLVPLYLMAASSAEPKFINLDMEEYHDLDLTVAVFKRILDRPELEKLEAGIVLQAYLPDALGALQDLTGWAQVRRAAGGAGIKVRLVKGANLAMEKVDAALHGWELATVASKQDADTNYKRCLDWALQKENTDAVRLGVAGHNLFDIAFAHLLADRRGVSEKVEFEMLLGMAEDQADAVRQDVGSLLLYTPVVKPQQFDVAISYLIRRLEENASQENFMSAVFELTSNPQLLQRETQRFLDSLAALDTVVPEANRKQQTDRAPEQPENGFNNADDSDSSLPVVRAWGREVLSKVPQSRLGMDLVEASVFDSTEAVEVLIERALTAQPEWAALGGAGRAALLRKAAVELSRRRGELIEVAASETGKTLAEGDVEISEAVDFANYYGMSAAKLDQVQGATFVPSKLTVVTPPWNFPIAITAGSILAPLAAGSSVIVKPAPQAKRCAAVVVEALWAAGISKDVLIFADVAEGPIGQHLISHPAVDRVILTGAYETAKLFRSWRSDLPLLAETSGKNAIIVTPSADLDVAAKDVVRSAFGHAGQKCSAASLVILVGSVADSDRFRNQLVDAVSSLKVGFPEDPETEIGPIIEPAAGKLKTALTTLGEGESWLVAPRKLDTEGRLYSPGVRTGVRPNSYYHLTEFFGPVLGVMTAKTLEEAIELQNASAYGLTAGLHTMDAEELALWLDKVQAGNLYVNRGITGAIVQRQPFGGWKRSSVGAGAKAGGPNYLVHLGSWESRELPEASVPLKLRPAVEQALKAVAADLPAEQLAYLQRSVADDQRQWEAEFGVAKDVSALGVERNVFRYLPVPVEVRLVAGSAAELLRTTAAGYLSGSSVTVSVAEQPTSPLRNALTQLGVSLLLESEADWAARVTARGPIRVRLVGDTERSAERALLAASQGSPDLAIYAGSVTEAGRIELLPFLHEQAVTITAHRFGNPDNISHAVL
ncbi:RHH-type proline utilization regulon transcriptional repressor/proline dehydrogenase/delta 1-pyrroline-5-carboxylate dehydrogenase [Psychromicrobium silvestre]|uniref:L-glutamate gamma-semialdehyde dehydrogenase n=1 Tax=Psychromicrobium silvestre TaxID=1645614 RepID=A0A7Y9LRP9_9MICC|nr:bifunctional proline dehydrogenase/L-glutamate gamma-semialdehyde dehydrogenase [Psychromicrobium silvestre]NYE94360.1 RHH-type proline utilization regulon transcriptional repressor/proline dehydrogenase/delta 1-pyrroline-5-carboxylate dehydrogenase [Psychromicrobium silvestre]